MAKYIQGIFKPENPGKYVGAVDRIVFRSSWELKVMRRFDSDPNIVQWNSEGIVVNYIDPSSATKSEPLGKLRRYFVDFWIKKADGEQILIEVKPYAETKPPVQEGKSKRRFIQECMTYSRNLGKWRSARAFAADKKMKFIIITEKDLMISR